MKRRLPTSLFKSILQTTAGKMLRYSKFVYCYLSFAVIHNSSQDIRGTANFIQNTKHMTSGTTFLEHLHWMLKAKTVLSVSTYDEMSCALECLKHGFCFSFNFAVYSRSNNCELLRDDKFTSLDRFQRNRFYHHYSIMVSCYNIKNCLSKQII